MLHFRLETATYLKQAGLIDATRRGYFRTTPRGTERLEINPVQINTILVERYHEFRAFSSCSVRATARCNLIFRCPPSPRHLKPHSPSSSAWSSICWSKWATTAHPQDAGKVVSRSSDGGIDEIIKEDELGLDVTPGKGSVNFWKTGA